MRRLLKLQHHKHTGKLIHHRHTSYRALCGLTIIVGFLIFMTGRIASASDLAISATVPAPIPAGTPTFTAPADGTITDEATHTFEGTCPVISPAVVIALYDNGSFIGSGSCMVDGTFRIDATIAEGARSIVATVVTITNDTGESSTPLHITYRPNVIPPSGSSATPSHARSPAGGDTVSTPAAAGTLQIISDKPFLLFGVDKPTRLSVRFEGGTIPYSAVVAWGDGETSTATIANSELQHFTHTYRKDRLYSLTITVSDAVGHSLTRHIVAMSANTSTALTNTNGVVAALDDVPNDPVTTILVLYTSLLGLLVLMWRYEFVYYRHAVGVPLHYNWQSDSRHHLRRHH